MTMKGNEDITCSNNVGNEMSPYRSSVSSTSHTNDSNCTNQSLIKTRFSDIIGHGAAKLRLDEMLLPLALPIALAQSILTGKFIVRRKSILLSY